MELRGTRCAVIGAGPIGLEAALYAVRLGADVAVYERGEEVSANVRDWGHVPMFSPFAMNHSPSGADLLAEASHALPDDGAYQSGAEYVETYLEPLAGLPLLEGKIELGAHVVSVGKDGLAKGDLIGQEARLGRPFRLLVQGRDGEERIRLADIVLDCAGMYGNPNALGNGGIPAPGERALLGRISYRLPDVLGRERRDFAAKTTSGC
jgi:threonine dehydrogenase-like Zn-dependent dehydrogenase